MWWGIFFLHSKIWGEIWVGLTRPRSTSHCRVQSARPAARVNMRRCLVKKKTCAGAASLTPVLLQQAACVNAAGQIYCKIFLRGPIFMEMRDKICRRGPKSILWSKSGNPYCSASRIAGFHLSADHSLTALFLCALWNFFLFLVQIWNKF
jgi:hypothetical protein